MIKGLSELQRDKNEYNPESQAIIESLSFVDKELAEINSMKFTEGWKLLEIRIRSELHSRIALLIKDDSNIQTLLSLLNIADTRTREKALNDEIEKLIP